MVNGQEGAWGQAGGLRYLAVENPVISNRRSRALYPCFPAKAQMSFAYVSHTASLLQQAYAHARLHAGPDTGIALLHLGAHNSAVVLGTGPQPQTVLGMDLGLQRLAAAWFKTTPPTPLALEQAIEVVEDVVMHLRAAIPRSTLFFSVDPALYDLAVVAGATLARDGSLGLTLDALEHCFNRLAYLAEGRPAAQDGLPTSGAFTAALLVLRECMHHLPFGHLTLLPSPKP